PTAASAKASWASKAERASESRLAGGGMNVGEESLKNFADFAIEKMEVSRKLGYGRRAAAKDCFMRIYRSASS
ncbi:MAG: hypothetical protein WC331_09375, partial [Candidatus Omnitrophota bacterium]